MREVADCIHIQSSPGVTAEEQIMALGGAGSEEERPKRKERRKERLGSGCILSERKLRYVQPVSIP